MKKKAKLKKISKTHGKSHSKHSLLEVYSNRYKI